MSIFKHQKVLLGPWISKDSALITSPGKFIHCWIILKQNIFLGFRLNVSFFYVYYYLYQYSHKMWVTRFPFHFLLLYSFMEQGGRIGLWYKIRMVFLCFDRAIWNFLHAIVSCWCDRYTISLYTVALWRTHKLLGHLTLVFIPWEAIFIPLGMKSCLLRVHGLERWFLTKRDFPPRGNLTDIWQYLSFWLSQQEEVLLAWIG